MSDSSVMLSMKEFNMNIGAKILLSAALGGFLQTVAVAQSTTLPRFEATPCPTTVKASQCGYLVVPETRTPTASSATIKLFVGIVRSAMANKQPDPLVLLSGGPGEKSSQSAAIAPLFPNRDFIFFDQRGVGLSQPALECPEYLKVASEDSGFGDTEAVSEKALVALKACGARLAAAGVNLAAFNTSESAADVNDLRQALGYARINLFGVSYGTRLAQEVMRSFPNSLRSVILDSVIPPQLDRSAETAKSAELSRKNVFAACQAQPECRQKYPDVEGTYNSLYEKLSQKPLDVRINNESGPMNADALQAVILSALYFPQGIGELPKLLYALHQDWPSGSSTALVGSFVEQFFQAVLDGISFGMFFTTECQGEIAFSSVAKLRATYATLPRWGRAIGSAPGVASERGAAVCQAWGLSTGNGRENDSLRSDVPTLLLGGEFDPVTPVSNLQLAAAGLSNATTIELKGQSHAVGLQSLCAYRLLSAFLNQPNQKLDTSCAATGKISFK
jgi:pimeloyl-ACP methyl ester carboxylesterase